MPNMYTNKDDARRIAEVNDVCVYVCACFGAQLSSFLPQDFTSWPPHPGTEALKCIRWSQSRADQPMCMYQSRVRTETCSPKYLTERGEYIPMKCQQERFLMMHLAC